MDKVSFSDFVKSFKNWDMPEGDLAREFIASKSKATTYLGIKKELNKHNACDGAFNALDNLHRGYNNRLEKGADIAAEIKMAK